MWSWPNFTQALEPLPASVFVLDERGHILAYSEGTPNSLPLWSRGAENMAGKNLVDALSQADSSPASKDSRVLNALRAALSNPPHASRLEFSTGEGAPNTWFQLSVLPVKGESARVVVTQFDITEQKSEEASRREAEDRYRAVVDATCAGYVVVDRQGRVAEANREFLRLLQGQNITAVRGALLSDWVSETDSSKVSAAIASCLANGNPQYLEIEWRAPAGTAAKFIALTLTRVQFQNEPHLAVFCLDLSVQKFAIATLKETDEHYRAVVETQTELICRYLPDTTLTFVNGAYCRFFGKTREQLIGTRLIDSVSTTARHVVLETVVAVLRDMKPVSCEFQVVTAAGNERWQHWINQGSKQSDGTMEIQGIGRDVTERHQAEEELKRSHREIQNLAGRLIHAQEEERRFIARELHDDVCQRIAAHAINLTNVRRSVVSENNHVAERLAVLEKEMTDIGNALRNFSHQLHPAIVEQYGLAAAINDFCSHFANQNQIEVRIDLEETIPPISAKLAISLYRIVQEIFGNIARHAHASHVTLSLQSVSDGLTLAVEDNGVGFEMATVLSNRGFGLISIEERVRYFDGEVSVNSQPGLGTRIFVQIPSSTYNEHDQTATYHIGGRS